VAGSLVLIDKQPGWTSHDVVAKLRGILGTRKIGHAGTLDPMATGLLVLGVDSGTKLLQFISGSDKRYSATIRLGQATHTDDAEGEVLFSADASHVGEADIQSQIALLRGDISQVPSSVSAIKVDGKRSYDLVRQGHEVELKSRPVTIFDFQLTSLIRHDSGLIEFDVEVHCSSGTYIRALARDVGVALGVGGHLRALRRTQIGNFDVKDASVLDGDIHPLSLVDAAREVFPLIELNADQARDVVHGKRISAGSSGTFAGLWQGELLAILEPAGSQHKSMVVFPEVLSA
jgi:tRNA pseudouridine55 synthase